MKNIALALDKFHQLVPNIPKNSSNPYFNSKYAALEDILPAIKKPLNDSGLVFTQFPSGDYGLRTILIHAESGEFIEDTFSMKPSKDDPQGRCAAITYQRRSALVAILGLNTDEDDDGNGASGKGQDKAPEPRKSPPAATNKFTGKPKLKELFEKVTAAGYTPDDLMGAGRYSKRFPEAATDFWKMSEKTAGATLDEWGYVHDSIIEFKAIG